MKASSRNSTVQNIKWRFSLQCKKLGRLRTTHRTFEYKPPQATKSKVGLTETCLTAEIPKSAFFSPPIDKLTTLIKKRTRDADKHVSITVNLKHNQASWSSMSRKKVYQSLVLHARFDLDCSHVRKTQLDVLLTNSPEMVVSKALIQKLGVIYSLNKKSSYYHLPIWTTLNFDCTNSFGMSDNKLVFESANWDDLSKLLEESLAPHCFSNVDQRVGQWYKSLKSKIDKHIPRATRRRATLPSSISNGNMQLMKKLQNERKKGLQWPSETEDTKNSRQQSKQPLKKMVSVI